MKVVLQMDAEMSLNLLVPGLSSQCTLLTMQDSTVPQVPPESRRIIKGRGLGIGLHPSFNRRPRDVLGSKGSWQIEDCARALECFLPLMFRPWRKGSEQVEVLQPPVLKECFGRLRRFGMFHMTHHSFDSEAEMLRAAVAAHQDLLQYCKAAEEVRTLCNVACKAAHKLQCEQRRVAAVPCLVQQPETYSGFLPGVK